MNFVNEFIFPGSTIIGEKNFVSLAICSNSSSRFKFAPFRAVPFAQPEGKMCICAEKLLFTSTYYVNIYGFNISERFYYMYRCSYKVWGWYLTSVRRRGSYSLYQKWTETRRWSRQTCARTSKEFKEIDHKKFKFSQYVYCVFSTYQLVFFLSKL